ncbi:MAG: hypothetical protein IH899_01685 [Planctomycetes bacterium]|nr:hypothetical protein [Planctomycetota bacterium]
MKAMRSPDAGKPREGRPVTRFLLEKVDDRTRADGLALHASQLLFALVM